MIDLDIVIGYTRAGMPLTVRWLLGLDPKIVEFVRKETRDAMAAK